MYSYSMEFKDKGRKDSQKAWIFLFVGRNYKWSKNVELLGQGGRTLSIIILQEENEYSNPPNSFKFNSKWFEDQGVGNLVKVICKGIVNIEESYTC